MGGVFGTVQRAFGQLSQVGKLPRGRLVKRNVCESRGIQRHPNLRARCTVGLRQRHGQCIAERLCNGRTVGVCEVQRATVARHP